MDGSTRKDAAARTKTLVDTKTYLRGSDIRFEKESSGHVGDGAVYGGPELRFQDHIARLPCALVSYPRESRNDP